MDIVTFLGGRPSVPSPAVLFDRLCLRFPAPLDLGLLESDVTLPNGSPIRALLQGLADEGLCEPPDDAPLPPRVTVRVDTVVDVRGGGRVRVGGQLGFSYISRLGWALAANSKLWCNGMDFLRSRLGDAGLGWSLDGATNFVGPVDDRWPALHDAQLDGLAEAFVSVWSKLRRGLRVPRSTGEPFVALREAELDVDVPCRDAVARAVALHGTYPRGTRHVVA
ncbi:MAG: hypothetical protein ACYCZX_02935, partial [Rhodospirillaceae bacterium]